MRAGLVAFAGGFARGAGFFLGDFFATAWIRDVGAAFSLVAFPDAWAGLPRDFAPGFPLADLPTDPRVDLPLGFAVVFEVGLAVAFEVALPAARVAADFVGDLLGTDLTGADFLAVDFSLAGAGAAAGWPSIPRN